MNSGIKTQFDNFIKGEKDYPLLVGFLSGFYPMVFYYSNNYEFANSYQHLIFFSFLFLIIPMAGTFILYKIFNHSSKLNFYKKHLLFVIIIEITAIFLSQVYFLTIKKKLLFLLLLITILLSLKFYKSYKKVLVFVMFLAFIPFVKCVKTLIHKQVFDTLNWTKQNDSIESTRL